jgi:ATP synthase in type III secretion protein N
MSHAAIANQCEAAAVDFVLQHRSALPLARVHGRVTQALGTLIRATGIRGSVGELCYLSNGHGGGLTAEVVGFREGQVLLAPFGELGGFSRNTQVVPLGRSHTISIGPSMIGRVLNGFGEPIDGKGPVSGELNVRVRASAPNALTRRPINTILPTGIRMVDALCTVGVGQRVGIFAPAGVGKSTLMGMWARGTRADVNVVALVGERGREVTEFIEHSLGPQGLAKSVVVVATSDASSIERVKCAEVATAIAEGLRSRGASVMLLMDSLTRYARALREIGLAAGEPPTRRGYPPSVFAELPRLLERAGNDEKGSITAAYTVLVEGDDSSDPIGEEVRSILDGHLVLSRSIAEKGQFPAVDPLASLSRLMSLIASPAHIDAAQRVRKLLAKYKDIELLLQVGEYRKGSDVVADEAIEKIAQINALLGQKSEQLSTIEASLQMLQRCVTGAARPTAARA